MKTNNIKKQRPIVFVLIICLLIAFMPTDISSVFADTDDTVIGTYYSRIVKDTRTDISNLTSGSTIYLSKDSTLSGTAIGSTVFPSNILSASLMYTKTNTTYPLTVVNKAADFDSCPYGALIYCNAGANLQSVAENKGLHSGSLSGKTASADGWYYWCNASGVQGQGPYYLYYAQQISFTSSDITVEIISEDGTVTSAGSIKITISDGAGGTVEINPNDISLSTSEDNPYEVTIKIGDSEVKVDKVVPAAAYPEIEELDNLDDDVKEDLKTSIAAADTKEEVVAIIDKAKAKDYAKGIDAVGTISALEVAAETSLSSISDLNTTDQSILTSLITSAAVGTSSDVGNAASPGAVDTALDAIKSDLASILVKAEAMSEINTSTSAINTELGDLSNLSESEQNRYKKLISDAASDAKYSLFGTTPASVTDAKANFQKPAADILAVAKWENGNKDIIENTSITDKDLEAIIAAINEYDALESDQKDLIDDSVINGLRNKLEAAGWATTYSGIIAKSPVGADDLDDIKKAISDYDKHSSDQQGLMASSLKKALDDRLAVAEWDGANSVIVGKSPVSETDLSVLNSIVNNYGKLSNDQKALVNSATIKNLKEMQAAAQWHSDSSNILKKDKITSKDSEEIDKAWNAYLKLSDDEKAMLDPNYFVELKNKKSASDFLTKNNNIMKGNGSSTDVGTTIKEYNMLTDEQKKLIDPDGTMLASLKADELNKKTAESFIKKYLTNKNGKIITGVTKSNYKQIIKGSDKWDKLTDEQKALVNAALKEAGADPDNYDDLLKEAKDVNVGVEAKTGDGIAYSNYLMIMLFAAMLLIMAVRKRCDNDYVMENQLYCQDSRQ